MPSISTLDAGHSAEVGKYIGGERAGVLEKEKQTGSAVQ
jgi:hypothetical protein